MRQVADFTEPVRAKPEGFEQRCRRLLRKHLNGVILQLSNLGYSSEFEAILTRLDEIAGDG
ncbi:MAG: hypothetical protein EBZ48_08060 [Proteobacteria bacterium]|nr:hypothetical protein [Pseudomonadota bacterium]